MRVPEKIYVLAGNFEQFKYFRSQLLEAMAQNSLEFNVNDLIYISDRNKIRGVRNPFGYFVGTFQERFDYQDIINELMIRTESMDNFIEVAL